MGSVKSVILLGAPGSGKGTQAKGLVSKFSTWKHISTGDLFRKEIASKSPLGLEVKDTIDKGNLVSDEITNKVFESQLEKILTGGESVEQIILDGYPRNPGQSRNLLSLIELSLIHI